MNRVLCKVALAVSWLLVSPLATAEPDEGAKLVARELMAKGRAQREAGDRQGALESFSKAHAIMHVPTTLLETARARVDAGLWLEALELLSELPLAPAADEPAPFARARAEAAQLRQDLEPRVPRLRVDVSGAPAGPAPALTVDGAPRPDCVAGCRLNPGRHLVMARTAHAFAEEQLELREREQPQLELVFSPLELPRALQPDAPAPTRERPPAQARHVPTATWVSGGVALVGLTAGAVFAIDAVRARDELQRRCAPACSADEVD